MFASETTARTGRSAGRMGLIVTGAIAGALALALLAGGGALVWAQGTKEDGGGYYATGSKHLTTPTYAFVIPAVLADLAPSAEPGEPPASYALQDALARGRAGLVRTGSIWTRAAVRTSRCLWAGPAPAGRTTAGTTWTSPAAWSTLCRWPTRRLARIMAQRRESEFLRSCVPARAPRGCSGMGRVSAEEVYASDCVESFCQSRAALGLVTWLQATGPRPAASALDRLVAGLDTAWPSGMGTRRTFRARSGATAGWTLR